MGISRITQILVICTIFNLNDALCTYPSDIRGTWEDSVYGSIAFSDSAMNMETKAFITGTSSTNFTCFLNSGTIYVSKSVNTVSIQFFGGVNVNVYICMDLSVITSSVSYNYYLKSSDNSNLNFGDVVPYVSTDSPTLSQVCNVSPDDREFHLLVFTSTLSTGLTTCPVPLLADFSYTITFGTGTAPCNSFWEGCSNTSVVSLNNSACGSNFAANSASGYLGCVYSVQDQTTASIYYVGVYNFDTSVNGGSTTRFTCFAAEQLDSITNVSQIPGKCASDQTPSTLPTSGALLQLSTLSSCAPVAPEDEPLAIGIVLAIVFIVMIVIFLALVIGICIYRWRIRKRQVKIVIVPKTLPKGAHAVLTMSDTATMVNKEIITEPKLVVKPIRNGQPQSMELQQWKNNSEFREPEGQLKFVTKPQPPVERIDMMRSRVATQMREEGDRKRNMNFAIDRVKTNLDREFRVISALKAKDRASRLDTIREFGGSKMSQDPSLAPPKSRVSRTNTVLERKNRVMNGQVNHNPHDHTFDTSFSVDPRTSTPVSVRPSSIDMVMSEANLSLFSVDLKYRASKTPKPQPDVTALKNVKNNNRKLVAIKDLGNMPGNFANFER